MSEPVVAPEMVLEEPLEEDAALAPTSEQIARTQQIVDDMMKQCLEDPDALSCVVETLQSIPSDLQVCKPKLVLLTQDSCRPCEVAKEKYSDLIAQGYVQEVNADSPEGAAVMEQNNLDFSPALVLLDCAGQLLGELIDAGEVDGEDLPVTGGGLTKG